METLEQEKPAAPLTQEERLDMRRRVLSGERLSIEEARRVFETLRTNQGAAIIGEDKPKKGSRKKRAYDDASLDADLKDLGAL